MAHDRHDEVVDPNHRIRVYGMDRVVEKYA